MSQRTESQVQKLVQHVQTVSGCSDIAATGLKMGLEYRDMFEFLGELRCVVCGISGRSFLQLCYIISCSDIETVRRMCS